MRLLFIEDDPLVMRALNKTLGQTYRHDHASTAEDGLYLATTTDYALIVLDLGLPDGDGIELCRQLRNERVRAPVLVLTARAEEGVKVTALDAGADDYLVKPFSAPELMARIRALLRRSHGSGKAALTSGELHLNPQGRQVTFAGKPVKLRRKEFDLLECFMRHPEQVLSRSQLFEHVWQDSADLTTNVVDVHIKYLRDKIDRPHRLYQIQTVRGLGYQFKVLPSV